MASLKAKLYTAASADSGLQALLLSGSTFQWADQQLPQAWNLTTKSAVAVQIVSDPSTFELQGRMATSAARVQFTVFGHGNDSENAEAVVAALYNFLGTLSGAGCGCIGIPGKRDAGIADTQPMTYMQMVDAFIWNDSTI